MVNIIRKYFYMNARISYKNVTERRNWIEDQYVFVYELSGSGFESSCSHLKMLVVNLMIIQFHLKLD